MRTNQDTPLLAASIRRVKKGVYDIKLYHPSGRVYGLTGIERFEARTVKDARALCKRMYPSTIFLPKGTPKSAYAKYAFGMPEPGPINFMDELPRRVR